MQALARPLSIDPTQTPGLSATLLTSHHANNYGGAVERLNAIRTELGDGKAASLPGYALNGLKREELIATNSMLLHELYFDGLGGAGASMPPPMELALAASFGSVGRWREEFIAMGKALAGGSGWVLLSFQPREGTLVNQWAADHAHVLAVSAPLLALDMYEHAYHIDYGAQAAAYVEAFMANVDWAKVYGRYQQAVHAVGDALAAAPERVAGAMVVDVRRAGVYAQAQTRLPGATWRDPACVADWADALPKDREVVVYCVYGHEVGRTTAMQLQARGVDAHFLLGGIDAWQQAGRPVAPKVGDA